MLQCIMNTKIVWQFFENRLSEPLFCSNSMFHLLIAQEGYFLSSLLYLVVSGNIRSTDDMTAALNSHHFSASAGHSWSCVETKDPCPAVATSSVQC